MGFRKTVFQVLLLNSTKLCACVHFSGETSITFMMVINNMRLSSETKVTNQHQSLHLRLFLDSYEVFSRL